MHSVDPELHQLISASVNEGPEHFRHALRAVFEQAIARCGTEDMDRILFVRRVSSKVSCTGLPCRHSHRARPRAKR